jgi:uncharacterized Rmd1/YagE family protein
MFEAECLHTPYLPPPSASNFRSPALKPQQQVVHVPEADLLNLGDAANQNHSNSNSKSSGSKAAKRRTGWNKVPGGKLKVAASEDDMHDSADEDEHEEEWVPDVFLFEYGTVVIWGMTEKEEKKFLASL